MLCEKCKAREATTHIRRVVNGVATERHLCAACAAKSGVSPLQSPFSLGLGNLLGSVFGESGQIAAPEKENEVRCTGCGATFRDLARTGQAGCAKCYDTFYDQLLPSLQRIHGRTRHAGKLPSSAGARAKTLREIDELQKELSAAVEKQEYEQAARIRDEIKRLQEDTNLQ